MSKFFAFFVVFTALVIAEASPASAAKNAMIRGSCADVAIPVDEAGEVDWLGYVRTLRDGVPVYASPDSAKATTTLAFGRVFEVLAIKNGRLEVQGLASSSGLGWVADRDLLCREKPLRGKTGLERKLYIRTETQTREGTPQTIKAYPSPTGKACGKKCRELSRFNGYFIFAMDETSGRHLLGDNYSLEEGTSLVGWVDAKDGFIWETAYGLRPREDLVFPEDHPQAGQERAICVYPTIEDAEAERNCWPVLGGDRWYKYPDRIPVLGRDGDYLRVILPMAGTGGEQRSGGQLAFSPEVLGGTSNGGIGSLESLKHVDVFFLIDGTSSMEPYIAAIRGRSGKPGVVQQIVEAFKGDEAFRETKLRFGFRVYRDIFAGNDGIGEGVTLSGECDESNLEEFQREIVEVRASTQDAVKGDVDYEENLFGGIEQAVDDMLSCPNHTKVLFVIGDHGYSPEARRAKGLQVISDTDLVENMAGNATQGQKTIASFFIQTPNNQNNTTNPAGYRNAYLRFQRQARAIMGGVLGAKREHEVGRFQLTSDDRGLTTKIMDGLKLFADSRVANEIIADLRGGTPLVDVITRLQGSEEFRNLPGLFWDIVKQGSCTALGDQCTGRIYDTIVEGYIVDDDDSVIDVWLKSDDLTRWVNLLDLMRDVREYAPKQQRIAFVESLVQTLQSVIGKPLYQDTEERLRDYLQRKGGLPIRDNSPLLNYSLDALMDPKRVPNCEILRLTTWLHNAKQMLAVVNKGDRKPVFSSEPYPGKCPGGANIPFIDGDVDQKKLGDDTMNYSHPFQKALIYWVPREFLP